MTLRACVYKNCGNYINLKDRTINDVKLFSFPKNLERRQKWIELGKVSQNIRESMYFFCSDHFDKKYLAGNSRRTQLVGEALPFPYVETEVDESYGDADGNLDYYLYEINRGNIVAEKQEFLEDQDLHVESTTMTSEIQDDIHVEQLSNNLEQECNECLIFTNDDNQESSITYSNKRKLDNTILLTGISSPKPKVLKTTPLLKPLGKLFRKEIAASPQIPAIKRLSDLSPSSQTSLSSKESIEDEMDEDQLVDTHHVTTFIFKGEEYIQMPKERYISEKIELIKKLRKMERTLKAIKEHLNGLDV